MHQSKNIKIKLITIINKDEYSWLILLYAKVNENQKLNHGGPSQRPFQLPSYHYKSIYQVMRPLLQQYLRYFADKGKCPNLQKDFTLEIFFRIYSKLTRSSTYHYQSGHQGSSSNTFEIFCWQGKTAQNHKGP